MVQLKGFQTIGHLRYSIEMEHACAIMQPYVFPYLGYFRLIGAVDTFLFYNDVAFIKGGWINRNRLWDSRNKAIHGFVFPLKGASQNKKINETELFDFQKTKINFLKTLQHFYSEAPYYRQTIDVVRSILNSEFDSVDQFAAESVIQISLHLGLRQRFLFTSDLSYENGGNKSDRLIAICKSIGASKYVNSPGGRMLYDSSYFGRRGIDLQFASEHAIRTLKIQESCEADLSVIHLLMIYGASAVRLEIQSAR